MSKVRFIFVILLLSGVLWYFYGDSFQTVGVKETANEIQTDILEIKDNPKVTQTISTITQEIKLLIDSISDTTKEGRNNSSSSIDKVQLENPEQQTIAIHNIEIGDLRSDVEPEVGKPQRSSTNDYGVNWVAYHQDYGNFFMAAYNDENQVIAMYTNQDLITTTNGLSYGSSKEEVLQTLEDPIDSIRKGFVQYQVKNDGEYHTFLLEGNYVTFFYDKHENNKVTAIQIIAEDLEENKDGYFAEESEKLREGFEYQLFDLTNAARVQRGLHALTWDESVKETARNHSKDMANNNYFSHTNLEGQSPFDRMEENNISFLTAGENLAAGQPSSIYAHEGLMNSIGHRENILKKDFEILAVGVAFNEESQPYYTENFLTR
ncbi:CAP-associated domain-containing protein [Saliterribacillus persicus]|uniref:Cysteine-rich secretory family protein n=1 Tax=Saliterribacillus persicus TaxID=930114 RepID=A0A368X6U0_9BACI|nr:CAP-associated domain-containing protein [Saliterribacillus persicus]RCW63731.1 cysteine-rich secretory family protein [Saliterribacillus persicus]